MQAWMRWALLGGAVLLVGVIAWRLTAGSYKGDIQKICNAETNAGGQRGAVENLAIGMEWAKEHLDTPEASAWFTELEKKGMGDRVVVLRAETKRLGIASCPLADTFLAVQADADYRTDLYTLCGGSAICADDFLSTTASLLFNWRTVSPKPTVSPAIRSILSNLRIP